jgi:hypothetical protein
LTWQSPPEESCSKRSEGRVAGLDVLALIGIDIAVIEVVRILIVVVILPVLSSSAP